MHGRSGGSDNVEALAIPRKEALKSCRIVSVSIYHRHIRASKNLRIKILGKTLTITAINKITREHGNPPRTTLTSGFTHSNRSPQGISQNFLRHTRGLKNPAMSKKPIHLNTLFITKNIHAHTERRKNRHELNTQRIRQRDLSIRSMNKKWPPCGASLQRIKR